MKRYEWTEGHPRELNWLEWGWFRGCERFRGYRGVITLSEKKGKGFFWDVTHWNGKYKDEARRRDIITGYADSISKAEEIIEKKLREIWRG